MVDQDKLRRRTERDYLELKQEVGLGHHEGRGLARLPPSCKPLCRGLRISISGAWRDDPQDRPAPGNARNLPFPMVIDPEDLPLRSQRHMPHSIATCVSASRDFGARTATMSLLRTQRQSVVVQK